MRKPTAEERKRGGEGRRERSGVRSALRISSGTVTRETVSGPDGGAPKRSGAARSPRTAPCSTPREVSAPMVIQDGLRRLFHEPGCGPSDLSTTQTYAHLQAQDEDIDRT